MTTATPAATPLIPRTFLATQPIIAAQMPGYSRRPQQEALAAGTEEILATAGTETPGALLAQAGTGTGKSAAASIPAILHSIHNRGKDEDVRRIILVTTTIALMNQYVRKDMPWLEGALGAAGIKFKWAQLKGISNYACLSKLDQNPEGVENLQALVDELKSKDGGEHTGDRDDVQTLLTQAEWRQVSSTSEECPGKSKCGFGEVCFGQKAKAEAAMADVVVTNAAMLMTDVKLRREMRANSEFGEAPSPIIGPRGALIIDEGHELLEIATNHLGFDIKQGGLLAYLDQATSFINMQGGFEERADELQDKISGIMDSIGAVLSEELQEADGKLKKDAKVTITTSWIGQNLELFLKLDAELKNLHAKVTKCKVKRGATDSQSDRRQRVLAMGENFLLHLKEVVCAEDHEVVRWAEGYEIESRKYGTLQVRWAIKTAPIDVAPILKAELWNHTPTVVMSATLATGTGASKFAYMARALGLEKAKTLDVGTPFDYRNQALLFIPAATEVSPAQDTKDDWANWMSAVTLDLVRSSGGGAMLLYSSGKSMRSTYAAINDQLRARGIQTFIQGGDLTNKEIVEGFRDDEDSVLFGMKSFMVGVDFPGRTNRLVVIDKLPFAPPDDPIHAAREQALRKRGGSPFYDLSVPEMTLVLNQAAGRLIRTVEDWGVMAILDSRLSSKGYGKQIVKALPPCPAVDNLESVRTFYDAWKAAPAA